MAASGEPAAASVSVVVPSLGRPGLDRLIGALANQTAARTTFEVIVVLNGPGTEWTRPVTAADFALRVIERAEPGRAGAVNAGAASATGELIAILDDDMEPVAGWLAAHRNAHSGAEAGLVLGPVPVAAEDRHRPAGAYVGRRFDRHLAKLIGRSGSVPPADVYTGNASIRRAAFRAIGGFDERFLEYGNEDRDFARRLAQANIPARMAADAIAIQHYDKGLRGLLADSRSKGRTAAQLVADDPSALTDTPLRRRGSMPRRILRRLGPAVLALPGALSSAELLAGALRVAPAAQDAWIETLVDVAVWRGAADAGWRDPAGRSPDRRADAP
jgi:GT2 family glycosyltransferase